MTPNLPDLTDAELRELGRLDALSTQGPFVSVCQPDGPCAAMVYRNQIITSDYPEKVVAERPRYDCDTSQKTFNTMLLLAAARNAIPRLLAEVRRRRAEEEREEVIDALLEETEDEP